MGFEELVLGRGRGKRATRFAEESKAAADDGTPFEFTDVTEEKGFGKNKTSKRGGK